MKKKPILKQLFLFAGVTALTAGSVAIPFIMDACLPNKSSPIQTQKLNITQNTPRQIRIYDNQDLKLEVKTNAQPNQTVQYHWYYLSSSHAYANQWEDLTDQTQNLLVIPKDKVDQYNNTEFKCVISDQNNHTITSQITYVQVIDTHFNIQLPSEVYPDQNDDYVLTAHLQLNQDIKNDQFEYNWYSINNQNQKTCISSSFSNQLIIKASPSIIGFMCEVKDLTTHLIQTSEIVKSHHEVIKFVKPIKVTHTFNDLATNQIYLQISNPKLNINLNNAQTNYVLLGLNNTNNQWNQIPFENCDHNWISFTNSNNYSSFQIQANYQNTFEKNSLIYASNSSEIFKISNPVDTQVFVNNTDWQHFLKSFSNNNQLAHYLDSEGNVCTDYLLEVSQLMGINLPQAISRINLEIKDNHLNRVCVSLQSGYQWSEFTKVLLNYQVQISKNTLVWNSVPVRTNAVSLYKLADFKFIKTDDEIWNMLDPQGNVLPQDLEYFAKILGVTYPTSIKNINIVKSDKTIDGKYAINVTITLKPHYKWDPKVLKLWPNSSIDGHTLKINEIPMDVLVQAPVKVNYSTLTHYIKQVDSSNYQQKLFIDSAGNVSADKLASLALDLGFNEPQLINSITVAPGSQKMVDGYHTLKLTVQIKSGASWDLNEVLNGCANLNVSLTDNGLVIDNIPTNDTFQRVSFDVTKCRQNFYSVFSQEKAEIDGKAISKWLKEGKYSWVATVLGVSNPGAVQYIRIQLPSDIQVDPKNNFYWLNVTIILKDNYTWNPDCKSQWPFITIQGQMLVAKYLDTTYSPSGSVPEPQPQPHPQPQPQPAPQPATQIAEVGKELGQTFRKFLFQRQYSIDFNGTVCFWRS